MTVLFPFFGYPFCQSRLLFKRRYFFRISLAPLLSRQENRARQRWRTYTYTETIIRPRSITFVVPVAFTSFFFRCILTFLYYVYFFPLFANATMENRHFNVVTLPIISQSVTALQICVICWLADILRDIISCKMHFTMELKKGLDE